MKVLIIALESINNVGENLLIESTKYLINRIRPDIETSSAQLMPRKEHMQKDLHIDWYLGHLLRKLSTVLHGNCSYKFRNIAYRIKYARYFSRKIQKMDKVIFAVGMIKYSTQDFSYIFHLVNKIASKYNKEVMMSAMSPQKASECDWRFFQLVEAVNMPSVKVITTRDGVEGVNILRKSYVRNNIYCDYVGDPALWIPETYGISRIRCCDKQPKVAINVIRKGIFDDYNQAWNDDMLFQLYVNLVHLMEKHNWEWRLFCNGGKKDLLVLRELQIKLGVSDDRIGIDYKDGRSYAEKLSQFDVVFGARLHCCITSVSLGVPVVGFIWDDKLRYFSETMGINEFFFLPSEMTAERVFHAMKNAMIFQHDKSNMEKYKQRTIESIDYFLNH